MNKTQILSFHAVIFGGDGDLSKRKIIPAFYQRWNEGQLNMPFRIYCISRTGNDQLSFEKELTSFIEKANGEKVSTKSIKSFFSNLALINIPENSPENFEELKTRIEENTDWQRVYYLSVPSSAFSDICGTLKQSELINDESKVVLEKPLGHDLKSSRAINNTILQGFEERQIFRIDHYLGKETVQNLMVLRFANHLFERAWNANDIANIQITVAEQLGVEKRAGYYDQTGALLDMVQNHLLQLLCLVAMEAPSRLDPDTVRNEKLKVLKALRFFDKESISGNIVRGQYTRGKNGSEKVNSYLEDIGTYHSETETFVAIKAHIDNWRWKNTPFYLRTGKRMKKRYSEIVINFKPVQHNIFPPSKYSMENKLIIRLQPEERIELVQMSKVPGPGGYRYQPISLKLDFFDSFNEKMPDAYERLIIDVLRGNQTLFMRYDELEASWEWIESINKNWKNEAKFSLYESGSWGPGDEIMDEGTKWETN